MITHRNTTKKNYHGFIIYKLTNPNNQVYIGATTNLKKRLKTYGMNINAMKNQKNLYLSLLKWTIDNHKVEILYRHPANTEINAQVVNILEQKYIVSEYLNNRENLLNTIVKGADRGKNQNNIII